LEPLFQIEPGNGAGLLNAVWNWSHSSKYNLEMELVFSIQSGIGAIFLNTV
jgi:hypothetical protein